MAARENGYIFQAVDDQHTEDGCRKRFAQILYVSWSRFPGGKQQERKKSCGHGAKRAERDRDDLLCQCHAMSPAFSMGVRNMVRRHRMPAIVGIIKESGPKSRRQTTEAAMPATAV